VCARARARALKFISYYYLPKSCGKFVRDISLSPSTVKFLSCTNPAGRLKIRTGGNLYHFV